MFFNSFFGMSRFLTLRSTNIAMGNGPFEDVSPIKDGYVILFHCDLLVYQRLPRTPTTKTAKIWNHLAPKLEGPGRSNKKMGGFCHRPGESFFKKSTALLSGGLRLGLRLQEAGGVPRATELVLGVAGMKRPTLLTGIPKVRTCHGIRVEKHREEFSKEMLIKETWNIDSKYRNIYRYRCIDVISRCYRCIQYTCR